MLADARDLPLAHERFLPAKRARCSWMLATKGFYNGHQYLTTRTFEQYAFAMPDTRVSPARAQKSNMALGCTRVMGVVDIHMDVLLLSIWETLARAPLPSGNGTTVGLRLRNVRRARKPFQRA